MSGRFSRPTINSQALKLRKMQEKANLLEELLKSSEKEKEGLYIEKEALKVLVKELEKLKKPK